MAPDSIVQRCSERRSSDSSKSFFSDGHDYLCLSRPSSNEDFNQFLNNLQLLSCDQLNDNSFGSGQRIVEPPERFCHDEVSRSFESHQSSVQGHANSAHSQDVEVMSLERWLEDEAGMAVNQDPTIQLRLQKASMIKKLTVGFGIGKLLHLVSRSESIVNYSFARLKSMCSIENFAVELSKKDETPELGWELKGVVMVSPFSSLRIVTSRSNSLDERSQEIMGRRIVAELTCPVTSDFDESATEVSSNDDSILCHLLGGLLHFFFTGSRKQGVPKDNNKVLTEQEEPLMKKRSSDVLTCDEAILPPEKRPSEVMPLVRGAEFSQAVSILGHDDNSDCGLKNQSGVRLSLPSLIDFGYSFSLSQLVKNLVDCGLGLFRPDDSYPSMDAALSDMQLLLQQPSRFLWDHYNTPQKQNLFINNVKMYGRSEEVASLTNAFFRVMSSGLSESVFIGGFSGCGKTRLVHSIFDSVKSSGGCVVTRKFDEMKLSRPLNVVLSALNELCIFVAQRSTQECLNGIYQKLLDSIGTNIVLLAGILPNVVSLLPSHAVLPVANNQVGMNFNSLCFTIQHLMRVISSAARPVLLFLDDLQWADDLSIKLVQSVLSDTKGLDCILFIGGFRENEVGPGHVLLECLGALSTSDVMYSTINLNDMSPTDVNLMISDTLGIFPRLCQSLASVVYHKTRGNPYFTLEFLQSLIARDLVHYSLREKCWKWNLDQISAENITDNVLHLLTKKINVLREKNQTALKVASCFGSIISTAIVQKLASTPRYSSLPTALDEAVQDGFMDFDGTTYRFTHDKVREAAYGLICDKEQYHLDLGMALQNAGDDNFFATIQQINRSSPSLFQDDLQRVSIASLSHEAGIKAMKCFDFAAAHSYIKTAVSLLPTDSWTAHYDLTLKCNFQLAKAAYCCGWIDESKQVCEEIIERGKCLEDTLETYSLLVSLSCLARKDMLRAFNTCLKVLNLLGEVMPEDIVDVNELVSITEETKLLFQDYSNQDLLSMPVETCSKNLSIMEMFDKLVIVSFFLKPRVSHYYSAKWAFFCLTKKVSCKYTPGAFVCFASMLSQQDLDENARLACRIGKLGMFMLTRSDSAIDQLPGVYEVYYTWTGVLTEPIQAQMTMCKRAYEIGMQSGNLLESGHILGTTMARSVYAGTNLHDLKKEIEVHLKTAKQYSQHLLHSQLFIEYEVVSRLIGDERVESSSECEINSAVVDEIQFTLEMMASLYLGHAERVYHKSKIWDELTDFQRRKVPFRYICTAFFSGLASFRLYSYGKRDSQRHMKNVTKSILILEQASGFSEWNFKNKYLLLKAAYFSLTDQNLEAEAEFNAAILASQTSKFVHEEGIACELAAMHHEKRGNKVLSLSLLHQAECCYKSWGSRVKELQIARQIELIQVE